MDWLLGIGILFGISIVFSFLIGFSIDTLLPSLFIVSLFTTWSELLPSELTFIFLIFNVIYTLYENKIGKYFPIAVLLTLGLLNLFLGHTIESISFNRIDTTFHFNIDLETISVSIIIGGIVAIALLGFNILGSGLNDSATHLITLLITYAGLWLLITPLAWNLLMSYKIIGVLVYFILFMSYVFIVARNLSGGI